MVVSCLWSWIEHETHGKMIHNDSKKHESSFTSVKVQSNNSVMLSSLEGTTLGVWISHGEGMILILQCCAIKQEDI